MSRWWKGPQHDSTKFEHEESQSYCVGADDIIQLNDYPEEQWRYSEYYDTYCVQPFCGKRKECIFCEHYHDPFYKEPYAKKD